MPVQVVHGLNYEFVSARYFPGLWQGVGSAQQQLLQEYTELLAPGPDMAYKNYHDHVNALRQNAKCVIPIWEIFLKNLYDVHTRRPWIVKAAQTKLRLLNMDKAIKVNILLHKQSTCLGVVL